MFHRRHHVLNDSSNIFGSSKHSGSAAVFHSKVLFVLAESLPREVVPLLACILLPCLRKCPEAKRDFSFEV